jgi:hypothetical protein
MHILTCETRADAECTFVKGNMMMYVCNVYVYVYTLFYLPRDPGVALSTREGGQEIGSEGVRGVQRRGWGESREKVEG